MLLSVMMMSCCYEYYNNVYLQCAPPQFGCDELLFDCIDFMTVPFDVGEGHPVILFLLALRGQRFSL